MPPLIYNINCYLLLDDALHYNLIEYSIPIIELMFVSFYISAVVHMLTHIKQLHIRVYCDIVLRPNIPLNQSIKWCLIYNILMVVCVGDVICH